MILIQTKTKITNLNLIITLTECELNFTFVHLLWLCKSVVPVKLRFTSGCVENFEITPY